MMAEHSGIGMTSQRTRDRLADTLVEMGIHSDVVLDAIRNTPRHLFVDEALATRAYENTALPIGFQPNNFTTLYCCKNDGSVDKR